MASWLAQVQCPTDPDPPPFRKRAASGSYPCAVANAKVALQHASLNSPIYNGLIVMPTSFPNLQQDLYVAVMQVVSYARTLAQWSVLALRSDSLMYSIGAVVLFLALYHEYDPLEGIVSNTIPYSDLASAATLRTLSSVGSVRSTTGAQSCPTRTVTSPTSTQVVRLCLFYGGEVMLTQEQPVCCTISGCNGDATATFCGSVQSPDASHL